MADDNLKHIDASTPEIQELVENVVGKSLSDAVNEGAFCPRCVAITLLEWGRPMPPCHRALPRVTFWLRQRAGATTAEDEAEAHAEEGGLQETRH